MDGLKRLLSYTRRAVDDYDMIQENENIAVGLSAGKDSHIISDISIIQ